MRRIAKQHNGGGESMSKTYVGLPQKGMILLLIIIFSIGTLFLVPGKAIAQTEKNVYLEGYIDDYSDTYILVRGQRIGLKGAQLVDPQEKPVTADEIRVGRKVEIYRQQGNKTIIMIHIEARPE